MDSAFHTDDRKLIPAGFWSHYGFAVLFCATCELFCLWLLVSVGPHLAYLWPISIFYFALIGVGIAGSALLPIHWLRRYRRMKLVVDGSE